MVKKENKKEKKSEDKDIIENKEKTKKKDSHDKIIKWVLGISFIIIILVLVFYFYIQSQKYFDYKGIEFKTTKMGEGENLILFYETITLLESNDGENSLFGFRIRTKPSKLERINFEGLENFELMKYNAYSYEEGYTFNCKGYGSIAMQNWRRIFDKMGMQFINDPNATCDDEGRYNLFNLKYGDKNEIVEVGNRCYDVIIKGNDEECEILPATEKIMVEMFVKYGELQE
jgi:hypothetical protein